MAYGLLLRLEAYSNRELSFGEVREIPWRDKTLLCRQARQRRGLPYVVVPGFKVLEYHRNEDEVSAVHVEKVPKEEQEPIAKMLAEWGRFEGPINFW